MASVASLVLQKRDDGLVCETRYSCVSWYTTTGSADCASGYKAYPYEAKGNPPGTYCETGCSNKEKVACASQQCTFYSSECRLYPGSSICAKAMDFCDAPMPMPKRFCTHQNMGIAVKYDDDQGICSIDKNPDTAEHYLRFRIAKTSIDTTLYMSCSPVTLDGARSVADSFLKPNERQIYCTGPDESKYELIYKCQYGKEKFDGFKKAAKAACEAAEYPGSVKPKFESVVD